MTRTAAPPPRPEDAARGRRALLARIPPLLDQHAGHEGRGTYDGSLRDVLRSWNLNPTDFMESVLGWGYTIVPAGTAPALPVLGLGLPPSQRQPLTVEQLAHIRYTHHGCDSCGTISRVLMEEAAEREAIENLRATRLAEKSTP